MQHSRCLHRLRANTLDHDCRSRDGGKLPIVLHRNPVHLVENIHPLNNPPEYTVPVVFSGFTISMIEMRIIDQVEKKLTSAAVCLIGSSGHGNRAFAIFQAVKGFIADPELRRFFFKLLGIAATQSHVSGHNLMKDSAVVMSVSGIPEEILACDRCLFEVQLNSDGAEVCRDTHDWKTWIVEAVV